ncbi:MAG: carbamoyltransferase [Bryobacteraceae bacterium]|nr:carbamoyltransferase [Bryobacteraceae bacterium]
MLILGLGGLLGDAACAALSEGRIVAAVEESKLTRRRGDGAIPEAAISECLALAGFTRDRVDCVALVRPFSANQEPQVYIALRSMFPNAQVVVVEHQAAHAASAYYASPFDEATVLTMDRAGDFRCGAKWRASGSRLEIQREWYYPDSLGRLYGAVTELLGFRPRADEHKVQWLSTAGDDRFTDLFLELVSPDLRMDTSFFDRNRPQAGGFSARFVHRLGLAEGAAVPSSLKPAIAAGLQKAVERRVLEIAGSGGNLCVAGGLFFNALLIQALEKSGQFENVFAQPAAGNAGTALGAALHAWHNTRNQTRRTNPLNLFLGPSFQPEAIKQVLENCKLQFRFLHSLDETVQEAVKLISQQNIVAWMQGRMEFGPRALGNRSILASPLNPYSTENLNVYIKHREPFRKFAASAPAEAVSQYFDAGPNARHLATVGRVRPEHRATFESAILGEDLVRVHAVHREDNPLYHRLLEEAGRATGLPVLYNTSFNLFGDPLVCTPRDAVRSFYSSGIDAMFVGNFLLAK